MHRDILAVALNGGMEDYVVLITHIGVVTGRNSIEAASCMFHPHTIPSEHLQKIWLKTLTMKLQGGCAEN